MFIPLFGRLVGSLAEEVRSQNRELYKVCRIVRKKENENNMNTTTHSIMSIFIEWSSKKYVFVYNILKSQTLYPAR